MTEKTKRNNAIIKLREDKWTIRKIARKYDLSEPRVHAILKREEVKRNVKR